jgi:protein-S-isoprenylcysteine O-methyltransferase Ste14
MVVMLSVAVLFGTLRPWLPIPFFVWVIQLRFIKGEECFLEEIFGAEYLTYKNRVRRWL